MSTKLFKKIICKILIVTILSLSVGNISSPKIAGAFVVTDLTNLIVNTFSSIYEGVASAAEYGLNYKEFVLDGISNTLAKHLAQRVTTSVVNWINSGFEGSPSFITDPVGFFTDFTGDIVGQFVARNKDLQYLCSPFSIDVRLSLALKYRPYQRNRYACTLDDIIKNVKNAGEGATLNGFLLGDFNQGGWPAFVSMVTEPQNNVYGAYLQADSELAFRIADKVSQQKDELDQGKGFLSWKKCTTPSVEYEYVSEDMYYEGVGPDNGNETGQYTSEDQYYEENPVSVMPEPKCKTQTPGSVIQGVLDKQLGVPTDQLNLADEFNEIVGALFAQLVNQVLIGGLQGVSSSGSGNINSYIKQIEQEQGKSNEQVDSIRQQLLGSMRMYIENSAKYKTKRDEAYQLMFVIKNTLESARACYSQKLTENRVPPLSTTQISYAQSKIADIQLFADTKVNPLTAELLSLSIEASDIVQKLESIKQRATVAKTIEDINEPVKDYTALVQTQNLIGPVEIKEAEDKLEEVQNIQSGLKSQAERFYQECEVFPLFR